jgi:hypothetical protein
MEFRALDRHFVCSGIIAESLGTPEGAVVVLDVLQSNFGCMVMTPGTF